MSNCKMSYFKAPLAPQVDRTGQVRAYASMIPSAEITVEQVHQLITTNEQLRLLTEQVRTSDDIRAAKMSMLPFVTPYGVFSKRNSQGFLQPSGLLPIDVDHLDSPDEARSVRKLLFEDPYLNTVLCFISPSGRGVKAFVPYPMDSTSNPVTLATEFTIWAMNYVALNFGPAGTTPQKGVDRSGKDIVRTCLLCYDEEAKIREINN